MGAARTPQNSATLGGCKSCSSRCSSLSPSLSRLLCSPRRRRLSQRTASRRTRGTDSSVNARGRRVEPIGVYRCLRAPLLLVICRHPVGLGCSTVSGCGTTSGASGPRVAAELQEISPASGAGAIAAAVLGVVGSDRAEALAKSCRFCSGGALTPNFQHRESGLQTVGINKREFAMQATRRCATAGRSIHGLRLRAPLAAAIATAALVGCAEYQHDGYAMAPGSTPVRSTKRVAPARISFATPLAAHEAKAPLEEARADQAERGKVRGAARRAAMGRSRRFDGGQ